MGSGFHERGTAFFMTVTGIIWDWQGLMTDVLIWAGWLCLCETSDPTQPLQPAFGTCRSRTQQPMCSGRPGWSINTHGWWRRLTTPGSESTSASSCRPFTSEAPATLLPAPFPAHTTYCVAVYSHTHFGLHFTQVDFLVHYWLLLFSCRHIDLFHVKHWIMYWMSVLLWQGIVCFKWTVTLSMPLTLGRPLFFRKDHYVGYESFLWKNPN